MLDAESIAEQVQAALIQSAVAAYEDAALRGLCPEGAWEVAVSTMRRLDVRQLALHYRDTSMFPSHSK